MTPIKELINLYTELSKNGGDSGFVARSVLATIEKHNLLEKEKNIISQAFLDGHNSYGDSVTDNFTGYYEITFE